MFMGATAAAGAIGFINMIGNLGGSVGPMLVGSAANAQAGYTRALFIIAPWPFAAAVVVLLVGYLRRPAQEARSTGSPQR
jgi:ACS family tartrate transporter-like MFS transporter